MCEKTWEPMLDVELQIPENFTLSCSFPYEDTLLDLWGNREELSYQIAEWIEACKLPMDQAIMVRVWTRCDACDEIMPLNFFTNLDMKQLLSSEALDGDVSLVPLAIAESITRVHLSFVLQERLGIGRASGITRALLTPGIPGNLGKGLELFN